MAGSEISRCFRVNSLQRGISIFARTDLHQHRVISSSAPRCRRLNCPPSGHEMPRPAGIASMMRLPVQQNSDGLDVCFVGVPLDSGTSNRSGARFGPRQIRAESVIIRPNNVATGAAPFESLQVADVGDVSFNMFNLPLACEQIRDRFISLTQNGCTPLAMGGDHTMSYPILQAIKEKHGAVGLIHVDAHSDTHDAMFGAQIAHGTPFHRALEEGCIDGKRVVQIGLRGSGYGPDDYKWAKDQGFRIVCVEECWHRSLTPLMAEVRSLIGSGPAYFTFDIDSLDPAYAPGTGTPEIAGLTTIQALEIIRGCKGLNIVGGDLVEVSPPFDTTGTTALTAANLLFEMLCILPGVKYLT